MEKVTEIVEGWTGRLSWTLEHQLQGATAATAIDGTGLTVSALDVTGADGTVVTTTGDYGWITQASGTVYYDPDADDLLAAKSPYRLRFQLTDGTGKVVWYPDGHAKEIRVRARYT